MRDNNRLHRNNSFPHGMETELNGNLSDLLDRCGHYHTHRIGASHRGQNNVLTFLAEHPDMTQKELGEKLGITPASLSEVLMKLEHKGYINRFKDEIDRRFTRVHLTEEGTAALDTLEDKGDDPFTALSKEEQELLKNLLSKLLGDWETRYVFDRNRRNHRHEDGRDFSCHGSEHPRHGNEHPGHNREHSGRRRSEHGDHSEREHDRDTGRRVHGHH